MVDIHALNVLLLAVTIICAVAVACGQYWWLDNDTPGYKVEKI